MCYCTICIRTVWSQYVHLVLPSVPCMCYCITHMLCVVECILVCVLFSWEYWCSLLDVFNGFGAICVLCVHCRYGLECRSTDGCWCGLLDVFCFVCYCTSCMLHVHVVYVYISMAWSAMYVLLYNLYVMCMHIRMAWSAIFFLSRSAGVAY